MTDEQLSALLRLKRYEQPPTQYFDRLLQDIHRRQRTELLQLPLWKIAIERVQTFFSEHSMGHLSYAGALATILVIGVTTIGLITPGGSIERTSPSQNVAQNTPADSERLLSLQVSKPLPLQSPSLQTAQSGLGTAGHQPRYVIDARPASYEPSSSFNF
jgi:hypothetical protein